MSKPSREELDSARTLFMEMSIVPGITEECKHDYLVLRAALEWVQGDRSGLFPLFLELAKKQRRVGIYGSKNVEAWDMIQKMEKKGGKKCLL